MRRTYTVLSWTTAIALGGCGVSAPEPSERASQAITGGTTDTSDPAVVALVDSSGVEHCTGTLIAPRAVLTAGHCAGTTGGAVFGATASAPRRVGISSVDRNPHFVGEGHGYDVAVMHLASAVTDVTPVPIADRALPSTAVGMLVRHVGFGVTNDTTNVGRGTKRTVRYPFTRFDTDPGLVWSGNKTTDAQTCNGDSGGPGLFVVDGHEQIVSLVSSGPACPSPEGNDARIDLADIRAWIRTTAGLCTPGVAYCGGDMVTGDPDTLYQCTDGNNATALMPCAFGCDADVGLGDAGAGLGDACNPAPTSHGGDAALDAEGSDADGAIDGGGHASDASAGDGSDGGCRAAPGAPPARAAWFGALVLVGLAVRRRERARGGRGR